VRRGDWFFELKARVKRNRRLATVLFYLADLAYLDLREHRRFLAGFAPGSRMLTTWVRASATRRQASWASTARAIRASPCALT